MSIKLKNQQYRTLCTKGVGENGKNIQIFFSLIKNCVTKMTEQNKQLTLNCFFEKKW